MSLMINPVFHRRQGFQVKLRKLYLGYILSCQFPWFENSHPGKVFGEEKEEKANFKFISSSFSKFYDEKSKITVFDIPVICWIYCYFGIYWLFWSWRHSHHIKNICFKSPNTYRYKNPLKIEDWKILGT